MRAKIDGAIRKLRDAELFRLTVVFTEHGVTDNIYQWRKEMLAKIQAAGKKCDCATSTEIVLKHYIGPVFPSLLLTSRCGCGDRKSTRALLTLDGEYLETNNIRKLGDAISKTLKREYVDKRHCCQKCGQMENRNCKINGIVFILVPHNVLIDRLLIPTEMVLGTQKFLLSSSIDRTLKKDHCACSCLQPDNEWLTYDNRNRKIERFVKNDPVLLIYERASAGVGLQPVAV